MLTPRERRRRAIRAIREARKRRGLQRDEHVERVVGSLAQLQEQIRHTLRGQPSEFDQLLLDGLLRESQDLIGRWELRAKGEFTAALEAAFQIAGDVVDAPFQAIGSPIARVLIPDSLLEEFVADGVELMDGLGSITRSRVKEHLELGLLGGQTPDQVMAGLGDTIRDPGPFKLLAHRAESATRTEMGRVHSKAGHRRMVSALEQVPELQHQWIWSGKSRSSHQAANRQVRPVGEPFDVGGERMLYPRAPGASAENTIMCGCEAVPYLPSW